MLKNCDLKFSHPSYLGKIENLKRFSRLHIPDRYPKPLIFKNVITDILICYEDNLETFLERK